MLFYYLQGVISYMKFTSKKELQSNKNTSKVGQKFSKSTRKKLFFLYYKIDIGESRSYGSQELSDLDLLF